VRNNQSDHFVMRSAVLCAVIVCASWLTSCGPPPEQVVLKFAQELQAGDFQGAKRYTTRQLASTIDSVQSFYTRMGTDPFQGNRQQPSVDQLESEITGDTAKVWVKEMEFFFFVLKKEKGFWKIDGFDINYNALYQMMQNMPEDLRRRMPQMPGGR
jgi:hypothetical protein